MPIRKLTLIMALAITLTILSSPIGYCADVAKIGTFNSQKILDNSAAGKAAANQINTEGRRMNADLEKLHAEIKELRKTIEQNDNTGILNKSALEDKKWELNRKVQEVKALKKRYDRQLQEIQVRLVNEMRQDVIKIISDYGKKEGYLLILEEMNIVYAPQSLDITDKIIQMYNAMYAKRDKKK